MQRHPKRRQVAVAEGEEDNGRHPKAASAGADRSRHVGMSASRVSLFIHGGADGMGRTNRVSPTAIGRRLGARGLGLWSDGDGQVAIAVDEAELPSVDEEESLEKLVQGLEERWDNDGVIPRSGRGGTAGRPWRLV